MDESVDAPRLAIINAARHSGASTVRLEAASQDGSITAVVADNGRGFPFKGRYDLAALRARRLGPATLKERVAKLGGSLIVDSTAHGSQVRISLAAETGER
jgi:signal transduction histidine kinase